MGECEILNRRVALLFGRAALIAVLAIGAPAQAQSPVPNFTSADFGWLLDTGFDYLPVEGSPPLIGPDPSWTGGYGLPAADFNYQPPRPGPGPQPVPDRVGPWNMERLSDVQNPNLKPWAAAEMKKHNDLVRSGRRAFSAMSRCWPGGPGQLLFSAEPLYFVQKPEEVWILWQRDHLVRRIYLDRPHSNKPKPSWFGESIGRYENGKLVVDTIGLAERPYSFVDNWRTPHTSELHTVERWKLTDQGNAIEATITIMDAGAFNAPWSGRMHWKKMNGPLMESVCPENNENYGKFLGLSEYPMPEAEAPGF
jgi:hypothetical protein